MLEITPNAVHQRLYRAKQRLIREYDGLFEAPPEFVALAARDLPALRTALAAAPAGNRWRGQTIDSFARHPDARALLERARQP